MIRILFSATQDRWAEYEAALPRALSDIGLQGEIRLDYAPDCVDYIVFAPNPDLTDFTPFTRCKAVLSLWAGVETIVTNQTLTQPLTRMVDSGLRQGMVEWVTGHVLRHHLGMDAHICGQDGIWRDAIPPLAADRIVTVLGMGELGRACASQLVQIGFRVRGWSKRAQSLPGIESFHGAAGFGLALSDAEIIVALLPLTPQTDSILSSAAFARMAPGAVLINSGRGGLVADADLLDALDAGQLSHATLDVFRVEPLPPDHAFWRHPKVTVTPHIASVTRPETASAEIAENIRRAEAGLPLLHLVDRAAGY